jgi:hypothetical protein
MSLMTAFNLGRLLLLPVDIGGGPFPIDDVYGGGFDCASDEDEDDDDEGGGAPDGIEGVRLS